MLAFPFNETVSVNSQCLFLHVVETKHIMLLLLMFLFKASFFCSTRVIERGSIHLANKKLFCANKKLIFHTHLPKFIDYLYNCIG